MSLGQEGECKCISMKAFDAIVNDVKKKKCKFEKERTMPRLKSKPKLKFKLKKVPKWKLKSMTKPDTDSLIYLLLCSSFGRRDISALSFILLLHSRTLPYK